MGRYSVWLWISCFLLWPAWSGERAVSAKPLQEIVIYPEREAPAEVVGLQRSRISAQVGGILAEIMVEVGDRVATGAVLARQDCWDRQGEEARAAADISLLQAELSLASRQKERASLLKEQGQGPAATLDQRQAELLTLEARLRSQTIVWQTAGEWLAKCFIKAPFAGVILGRQAQLGEWVVAGTPLFELLDDQAVELTVALDPLAQLSLLHNAVFEQVAGNHPVALRVLLPVNDPTTRTHEGRFTFTAERPRVGTAGRLRWQDPRPHVPAWLLVRRQQMLGIFLLQQGLAHFYPLPEAQEGRPAPWTGDIKNIKVILEGREGLQEGQQVLP